MSPNESPTLESERRQVDRISSGEYAVSLVSGDPLAEPMSFVETGLLKLWDVSFGLML